MVLRLGFLGLWYMVQGFVSYKVIRLMHCLPAEDDDILMMMTLTMMMMTLTMMMLTTSMPMLVMEPITFESGATVFMGLGRHNQLPIEWDSYLNRIAAAL